VRANTAGAAKHSPPRLSINQPDDVVVEENGHQNGAALNEQARNVIVEASDALGKCHGSLRGPAFIANTVTGAIQHPIVAFEFLQRDAHGAKKCSRRKVA
jgi:hypothetical protein